MTDSSLYTREKINHSGHGYLATWLPSCFIRVEDTVNLATTWLP